MDAPANDKAALRRRMRMVRDLVDDRLMRSVQLWAAVAATDEYAAATSVMAFVGCKGEPDTDGLFARLAADGKRLLLPRVQDGEIVVCAGSGPMAVSRFGVSEPTGPALALSEVGYVLVPGLAFTADGYRLGYGGGFYDRFLPRLTVANAGVCFTEQLVDALPTDAHDVPVQR
ncbi:MAG TPA: 5-formyltetrahydrofolate cyclo-ligase, partial [Ilumatobacteraceae bacterium]|nr:5-formyltetrahydrofolate cyclo-ligase [Ilumatobacteraceae bacterium]